MRVVRWQAVARSIAQAKEVSRAEFEAFVEAQTVDEVELSLEAAGLCVSCGERTVARAGGECLHCRMTEASAEVEVEEQSSADLRDVRAMVTPVPA